MSTRFISHSPAPKPSDVAELRRTSRPLQQPSVEPVLEQRGSGAKAAETREHEGGTGGSYDSTITDFALEEAEDRRWTARRTRDQAHPASQCAALGGTLALSDCPAT